jgi:hypothetical protein
MREHREFTWLSPSVPQGHDHRVVPHAREGMTHGRLVEEPWGWPCWRGRSGSGCLECGSSEPVVLHHQLVPCRHSSSVSAIMLIWAIVTRGDTHVASCSGQPDCWNGHHWGHVVAGQGIVSQEWEPTVDTVIITVM